MSSKLYVPTLQSLTWKLQGRITTQGDPCNHYREWVCSVVVELNLVKVYAIDAKLKK